MEIKDVTLSLKVIINKERSKVLFAEADGQFVDILLSFLTLPLGRILKVFKKQYGDESTTIGSLSNLYRSLTNLDSSHFVTEGAKKTLLNPTSSFDVDYEMLKLDISDSPPAEYFSWESRSGRLPKTCTYSHERFRSVSMYYDKSSRATCGCPIKKVVEKGSQAAAGALVYTTHRSSFVISDDLQIFPNVRGLFQTISTLGITDMDEAEPIIVTMGFNEIMSLLKASLTSHTPLSDIILIESRKTNSVTVGSEPETSINQIENEGNPNSKKMILKVVVQKSSGKVLYAQADQDFVEFLFSFFHIPVGGAEHLLAGKTCVKAIDNLYRSITDLGDEYFKTTDAKRRLMKPNLRHGCFSKDHILPLTEEPLPAPYNNNLLSFTSVNFPKGQGRYLDGPRSYMVTDDLRVMPFCMYLIICDMHKLKIPVSDLEEVELQIGLKEGLRILKASFTSTTALTDALLNKQASFTSTTALTDAQLNKRAKREV